MAGVGLSNHIDYKSTNSGDGDVVSWLRGETRHGVRKRNNLALSNQFLAKYSKSSILAGTCYVGWFLPNAPTAIG